jgi:hypothetical protein
VYLILVGKGASRGSPPPASHPTPSSHQRELQDSVSSSGGPAGISALDLGLIITAWLSLLLLFDFISFLFNPREKKKKRTVGFI